MSDDEKDDSRQPATSQDDQADKAATAPATSGHSDADSQARRNAEDESPS